VRNQKRLCPNRKLWPGYVFVDMILLDDETASSRSRGIFIQERRASRFFERSAAADARRKEVDAIKVQISASEGRKNRV